MKADLNASTFVGGFFLALVTKSGRKLERCQRTQWRCDWLGPQPAAIEEEASIASAAAGIAVAMKAAADKDAAGEA